MRHILRVGFAFTVFLLVACGVKGPPLPPIATTPQHSDSLEKTRPQPNPSSKIPFSGKTQ